jgi:hypothetical protein
VKPSQALKFATNWFSSVQDTPRTQEAIDNMRDNARAAIPIAEAMEAAIDKARTVIHRWDTEGLGSGDEKLINSLGDALRHLESLSREKL